MTIAVDMGRKATKTNKQISDHISWTLWTIFITYTQMFLSVRRCAETMTQLHRLKVKIYFKVMEFTLQFYVPCISLEAFKKFH